MSTGMYILVVLGGIATGLYFYDEATELVKSFVGDGGDVKAKADFSKSVPDKVVGDPKKWKDGPIAGAKLFSDEDIKYTEGGKLLLVIIGHVFDVTKGKKHYGPGSGYHGFVGRDASRAFTDMNFSDEAVLNDVDGLSHENYLGLAGWVDFYLKDYKFVGYHVGRFFDKNGKPTEHMDEFKKKIIESEAIKKAGEDVKKEFPPCNVEWKAETGTKYWCSAKSGGIDRTWAGYPFMFSDDGGRTSRCACIRELDSQEKRIRPYSSCSEDSTICYAPKSE
jgi:hypothetical protein